MKSYGDLLAEANEAFENNNFRLASKRFQQTKTWNSPQKQGVALARRGRVRAAEKFRKTLTYVNEDTREIDIAICKSLIDRSDWDGLTSKLENCVDETAECF